VFQYLLRRRWLWPDTRHYLNEYPWQHDWQPRLIRNEPALLRFEGIAHSSVNLALPHRYVDAPLYHLDCIVNSTEHRRAKGRHYELLRPGHITDRGFPVNGHYLPEDFSAGVVEEIPAEDLGRIHAALDMRRANQIRDVSVPLITFEETDRLWARRTLKESAYRAHLRPLEPVVDIGAGTRRHFMVEIHNQGSEIWPWGLFHPAILPATRWLGADNEAVYFEGPRSPLTADLYPGSSAIQPVAVQAPPDPGEYLLEIDIVHEGVRWFGSGVRLPVNVKPAPP
jgi:hypothetical protein